MPWIQFGPGRKMTLLTILATWAIQISYTRHDASLLSPVYLINRAPMLIHLDP